MRKLIDDLTFVARLVIAAVLGGVVGYERQHRNKSAGLRTHFLVCVGSCLVMELSVNLYAGVQGLTNADPARLAAQVVSGIGFLGAGTILKEGMTIRGLTTAASLWVVAAVGLAVGSGYYVGAVATTVLSVIALTVLPRFERLYSCGPSNVFLTVTTVDKPGQIGKIGSYLGKMNIGILDIKVEDRGNKQLMLSLMINLPNKFILSEVISNMSAIEGIIAVSQEPC